MSWKTDNPGISFAEYMKKDYFDSRKEMKEIKRIGESFESIIMKSINDIDFKKQIDKSFKKFLKSNNKKVFPRLEITNDEIEPKELKEVLGGAGILLPIGIALAFVDIIPIRIIGCGLVGISAFGFQLFLFNPIIIWLYKSSKIFFRKDKVSNEEKLVFLSDAYKQTISNLNKRLDMVKDKIDDQIRRHKDDNEKLNRYSHLFGDTTQIREKIDAAIKSLNKSYEKVSNKKVELEVILDEFIGNNGYLANKEKEIRELKIAQELSNRMKENFNTTVEITKNVDILTDVIVPGIERLMQFNIPKLIEEVEDKINEKQAYLEISK